jgi:pimeloyl-ACP methyl ester carboxylesterase
VRASLPDGRELAYEQAGSPDGLPVVYHHGGLRCRLDVLALDGAACATGVRLIAPDRPGIGASTRAPDRTLTGWPADAAALADALGDRVCAVATLGCPIPADWPGMRDQINRLDQRLMERSRKARVLLLGLATSARRLPERSAHVAARTLDERSAAAVLADPLAWAAGQAEGLADIGGVLDDDRVMDTPWGIDLARIGAPVRLWQGSADTLVPAPWAVRLAERVPHAQVGVLEGEGHVLAPARYEEILASLSAVARSAS